MHFVPAAQLTGTPARLNRVFMAKAGTYDVYALMKERAAGEGAASNAAVKAGLLKTSVTVPDLNAEFTTSSMLVADKVNVLTAAADAWTRRASGRSRSACRSSSRPPT